MIAAAASFCSTCGAESPNSALCAACFNDPRVPEGVLQATQRAIGSSRAPAPLALEPVVQGERPALVGALTLAILLLVSGSVVSVGLALALTVAGILSVRIKERQVRQGVLAVSSRSEPRIARLAELAAFRVGIPTPPVGIMGDDHPNAFALGFWGEHRIVLTTKLVSLLEPRELLFVLGHEMGHIRREHTTWLVLSAPPLRALAVPLLSFVLGLIFRHWQLQAEYSADRAGLLASRDLDASRSALAKVAFRGIPSATALNELDRMASPDVLDAVAEYSRTHPFLANRLKRLQEYAETLEKEGLI